VKNWIFVTGAPGSRWSGVGQEVRFNHHADITDYVAEKEYRHGKFSGHKGNYYGPGMLNGTWLDKELGTKEQWIDEINNSFSGPEDQVKVLMSHHFAYYLEEIMEVFPESQIIACVRDCDDCMEWWKKAGGWDITYPSYEWYRDDIKMKHDIYYQNKAIRQWVHKYDIKENHNLGSQKHKDLKVFVYK
jgi:hypothetical protein